MRDIRKIWAVRRQICAGHRKPVFTTMRPTAQKMVSALACLDPPPPPPTPDSFNALQRSE